MQQVKLGSRVYYKDNGPSDTGTIVDILLDRCPFVVKWDNQKPSEFKEILFPPQEVAEAFGLRQQVIVMNPADENIDAFTGDQLVVVEY